MSPLLSVVFTHKVKIVLPGNLCDVERAYRIGYWEMGIAWHFLDAQLSSRMLGSRLLQLASGSLEDCLGITHIHSN